MCVKYLIKCKKSLQLLTRIGKLFSIGKFDVLYYSCILKKRYILLLIIINWLRRVL